MTEDRKFKISPKPIILEDYKKVVEITKKLGKLGFTTHIKIIEKNDT